MNCLQHHSREHRRIREKACPPAKKEINIKNHKFLCAPHNLAYWIIYTELRKFVRFLPIFLGARLQSWSSKAAVHLCQVWKACRRRGDSTSSRQPGDVKKQLSQTALDIALQCRQLRLLQIHHWVASAIPVATVQKVKGRRALWGTVAKHKCNTWKALWKQSQDVSLYLCKTPATARLPSSKSLKEKAASMRMESRLISESLIYSALDYLGPKNCWSSLESGGARSSRSLQVL